MSSGQSALGAPLPNGKEIVRKDRELLKQMWNSGEVGWRMI